MYTQYNYKTKAELKRDVAERNALSDKAKIGFVLSTDDENRFNRLCDKLTVFQPNGDVTGFGCPNNGRVTLEGPHYPMPHRWYSSAQIVNSVVVSVK